MNKNLKISKSLKKYHIKKRGRKEIKIIFWVIALVAMSGLYAKQAVLSPVEAKAPFERMNLMLPENADKELTVKEWVKIEIEKAGLNWDNVHCLIQNESGWNDYAYNLNNNGTTDFGLWQINSIHRGTISVKDRWNYKTATKWAINKRLHDGNWSAWYGFLKCK